MSWVQQHMNLGTDPRSILNELVPERGTHIPQNVDNVTLWKVFLFASQIVSKCIYVMRWILYVDHHQLYESAPKEATATAHQLDTRCGPSAQDQEKDHRLDWCWGELFWNTTILAHAWNALIESTGVGFVRHPRLSESRRHLCPTGRRLPRPSWSSSHVRHPLFPSRPATLLQIRSRAVARTVHPLEMPQVRLLINRCPAVGETSSYKLNSTLLVLHRINLVTTFFLKSIGI